MRNCSVCSLVRVSLTSTRPQLNLCISPNLQHKISANAFTQNSYPASAFPQICPSVKISDSPASSSKQGEISPDKNLENPESRARGAPRISSQRNVMKTWASQYQVASPTCHLFLSTGQRTATKLWARNHPAPLVSFSSSTLRLSPFSVSRG